MIRETMKKFVCVRIPKANDLDLKLFEFDCDLTFAVFFLNADKTIYGRYGTRTDFIYAARDMSLVGLKKSMKAVLKLHRNFAENKPMLELKKPTQVSFKKPNDYPWLKSRHIRANQCLHCHQIQNAEQRYYRGRHQTIPDDVLFRWVPPETIGIAFDPKEIATIQSVERHTPADEAGLRAGDEILTVERQPVISMADVQWGLENMGENVSMRATMRRGDEVHHLKIPLRKGWRAKIDISWRTTTHLLRRFAWGGGRIWPLTDNEKEKLELGNHKLALKFTRNIFKRSPAYRVGFRRGDVIISYDGQTQSMTETQLLRYAVQKRKRGDVVSIKVLRKGVEIAIRYKME